MYKLMLTKKRSSLVLSSLVIVVVVFFLPYIVKATAATITYITEHSVIINAAVKEVNQFDSGGYTSCAIATDQQIYCAGYNGHGAVGNGNNNHQFSPVKFLLPVGKKANSINIQYLHVCALTIDQQIYCAGYNGYGQLGDTTTVNRSTPVLFQLPAGKTATDISSGVYYTCAITTDQLAYCAGDNTFGELGNGNVVNQPLAVQFQLPVGKGAVAASTAGNQICILATDQQAYCAGNNNYGQLGDGTIIDRSIPVKFILPVGKSATSNMSIEASHICVVTTDNLVYCAGSNSTGQLGDGTIIDRSTPVKFQLPVGKTATAVSIGATNHVCALTADKLIYCAGENANGTLGDGSISNRSTPVNFQLPAGKTASSVSVGGSQACALTTDKLVYCAGGNNYGQLGDGTTNSRSIAVLFPLPAGETATSILTTTLQTCVVTASRQVYCAGWNPYGQLGNGSFILNQTTPVKFQLPI